MDVSSEREETSRPRAFMLVLTLEVGIVAGVEGVVNMSKAVRMSDSWDGVRPVSTALPFCRFFRASAIILETAKTEVEGS